MANRKILTHCKDCNKPINFEEAWRHYETEEHINKSWNALPEDIRRRLQDSDRDSRKGKLRPKMTG